MSQLNRRRAIIFLGLVLAVSLTTGASAQESTLPAGDIVFIIDESGSMFNDALAIQRNLGAIVDTLQGRVDFRLSLVGFGAFKGHSDTQFEGQPHVHLKLTNDISTFRRTLDSFVTVGQLEPGFNAVEFAMNADLGYRPEAGTCAVLISDEGADIYDDAPTTKAEALQALRHRGAAIIGIVNWGETIDPGFDVNERDYGPKPDGLIPQARGKTVNVIDFRTDTGTVLRAVMEDCIRAINGEPLTPDTDRPSTPELPGGSAEDQPSPQVGFMLERLRMQVEDNSNQIFQLRNEVRAWSRELSSLRTTVSQLAERMPAQVSVQIRSIEQSVQQVSSRFEELRTRVERLQAQVQQGQDGDAVRAMQAKLSDLEIKLQQLQGVVGDLQQRPALTDRVAQLERDVASLEEKSISVEIRQEFESIRQNFHASLQETRSSLDTIEKRLAGISDTVARLGSGQQDQAARLEELNAQLSEIQSQLNALPIGALQDRMSAFDQRLSAVEQAIGQLQTRDQQTEGRLNALEGQLSSLGQSVDDLSSLPNDVVQLRSSLSQLDQRLSQRLDEMANRISANEAAMGELEKQIEGTKAVTDKYMDNFAKVMQRLDALQAELEQFKQSPSVSPEDLKALGDRVSGNESAIGRLNDGLSALQEQLSGLSDALDARSDELESALNRLNNAFESSNANISERLNALANRQKQVEAQLGQLQDALGQMEQIRTRLGQLRQRLDDLEPRVAANEDGVSANADAIVELQRRLGRLEETVNSQLGDVDGRLSDLQGQLDAQGQAIEDLNARLDGLSDGVKQELLTELQEQGGVVRVEVQEDLLTRRLAQIALAFSLAAIGVAWFLFMNR